MPRIELATAKKTLRKNLGLDDIVSFINTLPNITTFSELQSACNKIIEKNADLQEIIRNVNKQLAPTFIESIGNFFSKSLPSLENGHLTRELTSAFNTFKEKSEFKMLNDATDFHQLAEVLVVLEKKSTYTLIASEMAFSLASMSSPTPAPYTTPGAHAHRVHERFKTAISKIQGEDSSAAEMHLLQKKTV